MKYVELYPSPWTYLCEIGGKDGKDGNPIPVGVHLAKVHVVVRALVVPLQ